MERCKHKRLRYCYDCTMERFTFMPKDVRAVFAAYVQDAPILVNRGLISEESANTIIAWVAGEPARHGGPSAGRAGEATEPQHGPYCPSFQTRKVGPGETERVFCAELAGHDGPCMFERGMP